MNSKSECFPLKAFFTNSPKISFGSSENSNCSVSILVLLLVFVQSSEQLAIRAVQSWVAIRVFQFGVFEPADFSEYVIADDFGFLFGQFDLNHRFPPFYASPFYYTICDCEKHERESYVVYQNVVRFSNADHLA